MLIPILISFVIGLQSAFVPKVDKTYSILKVVSGRVDFLEEFMSSVVKACVEAIFHWYGYFSVNKVLYF